MLCLSHFRKITAMALTLEMKHSSPFLTSSTWTESVFLHTHTHTHKLAGRKKNSNNSQTQDV